MKKGFTLVEILFVLALISIVVLVGLSQMKGATETAQIAAMKADARAAIAQQQIDFSNNGVYTEVTGN